MQNYIGSKSQQHQQEPIEDADISRLSADDQKLLFYFKDLNQRYKNSLNTQRRFVASFSSSTSSSSSRCSASPSSSSSSLSSTLSPVHLAASESSSSPSTAITTSASSSSRGNGSSDCSSDQTNITSNDHLIDSDTSSDLNNTNHLEYQEAGKGRRVRVGRKRSLGFQLRALNDSATPRSVNSTATNLQTSPSSSILPSSSEPEGPTTTATPTQFSHSLWSPTPSLPANVSISSLSSELVSETLNYFVNCSQRVSQMTKTYDDNDAYILLLQEKEVDLELAARIGQDLLNQNKQLREFNERLETQLSKKQEDIQQLKHELASKVSLLDTFIEEEENQTSLAESLDDSTSNSNHYSLTNNINIKQASSTLPSLPINTHTKNKNSLSSTSSKNNQIIGNSTSERASNSNSTNNINNNDARSLQSNLSWQNRDVAEGESDTNNNDNENYEDRFKATDYGFSSLNTNAHYQRSACSSAEPFLSLPPHVKISKSIISRCESSQPFPTINDSPLEGCSYEDLITSNQAAAIGAGLSTSSSDKQQHQQQLVESVTFRLVETNKRLCELQDELIYKCEQNLTQQEKIYQLQEQLSELDRRLGDVSLENESLHRSMQESSEIQKELNEELKVCKRNFSELLNVFFELQRESRLEKNRFEESHQLDFDRNQYDSMYFDEELNQLNDSNINISYDFPTTTNLNACNTIQTGIESTLSGESSTSGNQTSDIGTTLTPPVAQLTDSSCTFLETNFYSETESSNPKILINSNLEIYAPERPSGDSSQASGMVVSISNQGSTSGETRSRKWISFSSYMITTLIILCLSVTITSNANLNMAYRLQLKYDK